MIDGEEPNYSQPGGEGGVTGGSQLKPAGSREEAAEPDFLGL